MAIYSVDKITDTKNASDTLVMYRINFVSIDKYITDMMLLQRGFTDYTHSEMVRTLFNDYYRNGTPPKDLLHVTPTLGKHTLCIPKYTPSDAMNFISRRAVTENLTDDLQQPRFFETRLGFFFTTHDELNRREVMGIPNDPEKLLFTYTSEASFPRTYEGESQDRQLQLMQEIIEFEFADHVNTIGETKNGAYRRRTTQLDVINGSYLPEDYDHWDFIENYSLPDGRKKDTVLHKPEFVEEYMRIRDEILVIKDYATIGEAEAPTQFFRKNTYYPEAYNKKYANYYHHNTNMSTIKINGRNDLTAGSLIILSLPKMLYDDINKEQRSLDMKRSGFYLVESVNNVFYEDTYYQVLKVSKSGYRIDNTTPEGTTGSTGVSV